MGNQWGHPEQKHSQVLFSRDGPSLFFLVKTGKLAGTSQAQHMRSRGSDWARQRPEPSHPPLQRTRTPQSGGVLPWEIK